jgi:hypothetical protein
MRRLILLCLVIFLQLPWKVSSTEANYWRLSDAPVANPGFDRQLLGQSICGEGNFEAGDTTLRCKICPEFTGRSGSSEGLEIRYIHRGRFSSRDVPDQLLIDTDGCEAHFESLGGALFLGTSNPKPEADTGVPGPGRDQQDQPIAGPITMYFYRPGFRLDDCLLIPGKNVITQLVCNEADMAQGEVIGHISVMKISRRQITRWRLVRWYDNSGTESEQVMSVIPTAMRLLELDSGQPGLQISLKIVTATREAYEKQTQPSGTTINLLFERKGLRYFATDETKRQLSEISTLTRKMME